MGGYEASVCQGSMLYYFSKEYIYHAGNHEFQVRLQTQLTHLCRYAANSSVYQMAPIVTDGHMQTIPNAMVILEIASLKPLS